MSGSNTSKIERVSAPGNPVVWVDLCLDKRSGFFFAVVGNERISEKTKEAAFEKTRAALAKLGGLAWREVIVVTVAKHRSDGHGQKNGIPQHHASCSVSYERVERSPNPMRRGEEIERLHSADFEDLVAERREHTLSWRRQNGKEDADREEAELRQQRLSIATSHAVWKHDAKSEVEHEIPYSPEAWAGIERVARTLRETQERLDEFAAGWTQETLSALGHGVASATLFLPEGTGAIPPARVLRGGGGKKR
jgi:hypothetical protein